MTFAVLARSKRVTPAPTRLAKGKSRGITRDIGSRPGFVGTAPRLGAAMSSHPPALQTKLKVGAPNDRFEQEADRVAEQVMRMPEPCVTDQAISSKLSIGQRIQRLCPECEQELHRQSIEGEEEETIQAKGDTGHTAPAVTSDVASGIQSLKGGGQPLADSVRGFFEPRFGVDFSGVRVHTGVRAAQIAQAINAQACTLGGDMVFGAGQYSPEASDGRKLLAHELTHVVQQSDNIQGELAIMRKAKNECPKLVSFTASGKNPTLSDSCNGKCRFGLGCCPTERGKCGSSASSGMVFSAVVRAEEDCKGELGLMQNLLSTRRKVTKDDNTEECLETGEPHRDGGIPWKGCTVSVNRPGKFTITSDDCPHRVLTDDPARFSVKDSFRTFLLWKTEGARARMPIASVTWGWSGEITKTKGKECASRYRIVSSSHTDGEGKESKDKPVTDPKVKDIKVGPCK